MEIKEYRTFDTLRPHFDALARVAYFKIILRTQSPMKRRLHDAYRILTWILVITYNLQHFIRVFQSSNIDEVVDTLFILLTTLNTLGKQITFNSRSARIDRIIGLINGPDFALSKPYHVTAMRSNGLVMARILKLYQLATIFCGTLWTIFPIINRVYGKQDMFTGYIPFGTGPDVANFSNSFSVLFAFELLVLRHCAVLRFGLALAYMSILITFQAYGHVTMDCTIVAFISQARTQLQILRYNLEQVANLDGADSKINIKRYQHGYKDDEGVMLQRRLVRSVEHHTRILWFVQEIQSIFGEALVVQFIIMAWVICMTVYKIANLSILSAEFVSMAVYLGCMLAQLFIYCYFGSQLKLESELINQSVYNADWLSLSPRFRRQLLVMMQFCHNPISLRTAYIVPMSLDTYIKVLKSSYTLFTFLNR